MLSIARSHSPRDLRRALRQLPRDRRRDIAAAIREGREVKDPRDAGIAVAYAQRIERVHWPWWLMPRSCPHGKRAWLWLLHAGWLVAATVLAFIMLWPILPGVWRWVVVGVYGYSAVTTPRTIARVLRAYWNAPAAIKKNRQLLARQH